MIQVTATTRVWVAVEAVDFRKGIDGLAQVCRQHLQQDPMSGAMFVFRNRRATAVKILAYDGQGFWLCHKRLSQGRFGSWPRSATQLARFLAAHELHVLLSGGNPDAAGGADIWRPVVVPL
ncbi:MAG: IS66 family insertion sequence element accessory protein TnpB [Chloroflexi bacterium]|nr:IS66 family insertion sequence element accessory protein TnpB [Chloroflexota bacterium]